MVCPIVHPFHMLISERCIIFVLINPKLFMTLYYHLPCLSNSTGL